MVARYGGVGAFWLYVMGYYLLSSIITLNVQCVPGGFGGGGRRGAGRCGRGRACGRGLFGTHVPITRIKDVRGSRRQVKSYQS